MTFGILGATFSPGVSATENIEGGEEALASLVENGVVEDDGKFMALTDYGVQCLKHLVNDERRRISGG